MVCPPGFSAYDMEASMLPVELMGCGRVEFELVSHPEGPGKRMLEATIHQ